MNDAHVAVLVCFEGRSLTLATTALLESGIP